MTNVLIALIVGVSACVLGAFVTYILARERARLAEATFLQGLAERERAAEVMHGTIREQASRLRDADMRMDTAVEAERQATESARQARILAEQELDLTRAALKRVQAEWAGLNAELVALRSDHHSRVHDLAQERDRLQEDLSSERLNALSSEAGLQAELARVREERAVLTLERDALARERNMLCEAADRERTILRRRIAAAQQLLRRAREEAAQNVSAERQSGMDLVRRLWEYLKPEGASSGPPIATTPSSSPEPTPAAAQPSPVGADIGRPIPVENGLADRAPRAENRTAEAGPTPQTRSSEPFAAGTATGAPQNNGTDAPADIGLTVHTLPANLRRPLAVVQEGDTMRVVCDDGAVWERGPDGWRESTPLPGSRSDAVRKFQDGLDARRPSP